MKGARFCFSHNPEAAARKRAAVAKGGRNRRVPELAPAGREPVKIESVNDLQRVLFTTMAAVCNGRLDANVARTIGYLAGMAAKVTEVVDLAAEVDELHERVYNEFMESGFRWARSTHKSTGSTTS